MKPSSVTLAQMLDARERRAFAQTALLRQADANDCLVSFSLNIAGDVKRTPKTRLLFDQGLRTFDALGFAQRERTVTDAVTGTEALILVRANAKTVKTVLERLEEAAPWARLFDFDVLNAAGEKLSRKEPRRCLVCGGPAADCARSRAHGLDAVRAATDALLDECCADTLALTAHAALERELRTTPKPGLVDENNNGAHADMDVPLFLKSAASLVPYFRTAVRLGMHSAGMDALKEAGLDAERAMFEATDGVNTHKGMVYSMGLLLYGMGESLCSGADAIDCAAHLAAVDANDRLSRAKRCRDTNGGRVYADTGATGAVGEAAGGFTHARFCADRLAFYRDAGAVNPGALALCDTMAILEDTNVLHRGGREGLAFLQGEARRIGALDPEEREAALGALDAACIRRNLSPGGSADMLALAYLLDAWHALKKDLFWEVCA